MRHFIAYHNCEKMGRPLSDGDPFRVLTNKPVEPLLQNTVWFIQGDAGTPKRFSLASVFVASECGNTGDDQLKRFASGQGQAFVPPIPLNDLEWFPEFCASRANFSIGVHELKDDRFIDELLRLAAQAGYQAETH